MLDDTQNEAVEEAPETPEALEAVDIPEPLEEGETPEEERPREREEDYKEKYYYLAAEMENLRKRHGREKEEILKFGTERIARGLLEVMDNLERALEAMAGEKEEKVKNLVVGVDMVREQFFDVLKNNGLKPVEAIGQSFDPNIHEAFAQQEDSERENGEILLEYQKGYTLNGRLLRPAKVSVVNNKKEKKGE